MKLTTSGCLPPAPSRSKSNGTTKIRSDRDLENFKRLHLEGAISVGDIAVSTEGTQFMTPCAIFRNGRKKITHEDRGAPAPPHRPQAEAA